MQFSGMDDKTLSGVFAELSNHITVFATSDDLQRALSGEGRSITPADIEGGYDIFCCIPEHKLEEWKDLLGMMCNQFLKSFERRGEGNKTPILFLIDEFPRLGKIEAISNGQSAERTSYQPNPIYERQANEIESISKTISEQSRTIKSLQEERDKLGIFKGREKKELQNKIDNFERLRRSNLDKLGALGVSEPSKADEAVKEKRSMAAQEQNRAKAAMQNRGAKERAEEVKAAFLEAAKQIPADQRQEILDRMGQQKEIPTMGRLQYYQAEAEARRQLDTALKQEAQTRERNRTHDRDRGI